jgi:hypothetical protein
MKVSVTDNGAFGLHVHAHVRHWHFQLVHGCPAERALILGLLEEQVRHWHYQLVHGCPAERVLVFGLLDEQENIAGSVVNESHWPCDPLSWSYSFFHRRQARQQGRRQLA